MPLLVWLLQLQAINLAAGAYSVAPQIRTRAAVRKAARCQERRCVMAAERPSGSSPPASGRDLGEWAAAAVAVTSAEISRATGLVGRDDNRTEVQLVADGAPQTLATAATAAVGIKVAVGVASKMVATAATVAIASPALKLASLGAGIFQIGMEKFQSDRQQRAINRTAAVLAEKEAEAERARARLARLECKAERCSLRTNALDWAVCRLPSAGTTTTPKVVGGALIGAAIGSAVPAQRGIRLAAIAVGYAAAFRGLRGLSHVSQSQLNERAAAAEAAAARAAELADAAKMAAEAARKARLPAQA